MISLVQRKRTEFTISRDNMKNSQLIKRNDIAGGYTKVYPLAYIQGITDGITGEYLTNILQSFNHIYLPYEGSAKDTRTSLPEDYRRQGIWITYNSGNGIITEIYKGTADDLYDDVLFGEDINWERVPDLKYVQSNASKIPDGAILPDMLSPALWELLGSNNTITNLPDEEDLTQECNVLSFKDRIYDSEVGKGYKILRKNWVTGVNVLSPDELSLEHTIYEIRYDFDLQGQTVTLPEGCVLLFKGGTINNGIVVCNYTDIIGINKFEDGGTATFSGSFNKGLMMAFDNTVMWYNGSEWKKIETDLVAYTVRVVEVTSPEEATAEATMVGTEIQFKFGLPKGEKGDKGDTGPKGDKGDDGTIAGLAADKILFDEEGNVTLNELYVTGYIQEDFEILGASASSLAFSPNKKNYLFNAANSNKIHLNTNNLFGEGETVKEYNIYNGSTSQVYLNTYNWDNFELNFVGMSHSVNHITLKAGRCVKLIVFRDGTTMSNAKTILVNQAEFTYESDEGIGEYGIISKDLA